MSSLGKARKAAGAETGALTARQVQPGMRLKMLDGSVCTVASVSRGFAMVERDGVRKRSVLIEYRGGGWSQLHPDAEVTLAEAARATGETP